MTTPKEETLREVTGFTTPIGAYAESRFALAWEAASDSQDRVNAVFQYAEDLYREQQYYAEISPYGVGLMETVEEIAARTALERGLSREEWQLLDAELEEAGYMEQGPEKDLAAAWSAAGSTEERIDAIFQYAKNTAGVTGTVQEIAARTALEKGLTRAEWTALDVKLCEAGYLTEQLIHLNQCLGLYPQVKDFAEHGQAQFIRWEAEQEEIRAREQEWAKEIEVRYQQLHDSAMEQARQSGDAMTGTSILYRILHPFLYREQMRLAAQTLETALNTLGQSRSEATASWREEMTQELTSMWQSGALWVPEFLGTENAGKTVQLVELSVGDWVTPEAVSNAIAQSQEWCSQVEQAIKELPQELKPYLNSPQIHAFERWNPPEVSQEAAPEAQQEPQMQAQMDMELEMELY